MRRLEIYRAKAAYTGRWEKVIQERSNILSYMFSLYYLCIECIKIDILCIEC